MKKIRRQSKKLLSLILSMAMLMTMLITFDVGALSASAADSLPVFLSGGSLGTTGKICVYVPETIYLNPIASPDGFSFQYFADRENTTDGNLIATPNKTSGNVFIFIPQADHIADVQAVGSGMTAVIGQKSTASGVNVISTTVTGYSSSYASGVLSWTVSYVDAETDEVNTVTASSYVYAPNVNPDNSVISVTINPGAAKSLSNKDGYLCSTAWITGAHRIISSCYGILSDRDGILSAGSADFTGSYMNNFLLNPSYTVPAADYRSVSVYNTNGIGGSGYWSTDDDVHYQNGGMGEINIDSSRYTNLGQIPDLFTGVDCNGVYESPATVSLDYGWYSDCAGNLYNVNNCAVSSQDVQNGSYAVINGQRFTGFNGACFAPYLTTTKTLIVKQTNSYRMRGSIGSSSKNVTGEGLCYLKCKFYDKSEIRNIYNLVTGCSNYLQQRFFISDVWSRFSALHSRIGAVLGQPDLDMSTFNHAELAEYYDLASAMVACKAAEDEEGDPVPFTDYNGNIQSAYKNDYLMTDGVPADCSALCEAIAEAEDLLNQSCYTEESIAALIDAFDYACEVLETATTQSEIDDAAEALWDAIYNLELRPVEEEHVWGSWYMVVNPTLTAAGLMRRDCQNCDEYEEMTVPALIPDFVTGVSLGSKSIALSMGDKVILYSEVEPETALNQSLIWESTDPNVVTVNQSGKITAVGVGVANIVVRSAENPNIMDYCMVRVASLIASGSFTVVDNDSGLIYGLSPNLTSLDGYVDIVDETTSILIEEQSIGTGTEINIVRDDEIVDTYTAVIFGDANGDAWYDGTDSLIVNCLANGLLSKAQVGEAVYTAADCNHDGVIDENDVYLLEQAGLILAGVDQSKTSAELFEDAAFGEYISLIDQSPVAAEEITAEETAAADAAPADEPAVNKTLIQKIIDIIICIFKMITAYIPKVF